MGNILAGPSPQQRAPRAKDIGQERRQVHREVGRERSQVAIGMRRELRNKISQELITRPLTHRDVEQIRFVLLQLAPPCKDETPPTCALPQALQESLALVESAEGRTLTGPEVRILVSTLVDEAPVQNLQPKNHHRMAQPVHKTNCQCMTPGCPECAAPPFVVYPLTGHPVRPRIQLKAYPDIPMRDDQYNAS